MWPAAESLAPNATSEHLLRHDDAARFLPSPLSLPVRSRESSGPLQPLPSNWTEGSLPDSARQDGPFSSSSSSEFETTNHTATYKFPEIEEDWNYERRNTSQSRGSSTADGLSYGVVVNDSELVGAVLDGIGRVTVTMRLDSGGRWRILRDSSHLSEWL